MVAPRQLLPDKDPTEFECIVDSLRKAELLGNRRGVRLQPVINCETALNSICMFDT
jgi:hypothetical protein